MASVKTWGLLAGAIAVPILSVVFVGAVAGWFGSGSVTKLDPEYYVSVVANPDDWDFIETLTPEKYQELVEAKKSFILFVDQGGCNTADRLRGFIRDYASENGLQVYRMMFADLKNTSLKGQVKYYPSVVIVSNGNPVQWLDTSSAEDVEEYNEYEAFSAWMNEKVARP